MKFCMYFENEPTCEDLNVGCEIKNDDSKVFELNNQEDRIATYCVQRK